MRRRVAAFPKDNAEAEKALLLAFETDTFDDRVSEEIFDAEDEHAEVAIIQSLVARSQ